MMFLAYIPAQAELLQHNMELAAKDIGFYVKSDQRFRVLIKMAPSHHETSEVSGPVRISQLIKIKIVK